jgi:hypothetical protein
MTAFQGMSLFQFMCFGFICLMVGLLMLYALAKFISMVGHSEQYPAGSHLSREQLKAHGLTNEEILTGASRIGQSLPKHTQEKPIVQEARKEKEEPTPKYDYSKPDTLPDNVREERITWLARLIALKRVEREAEQEELEKNVGSLPPQQAPKGKEKKRNETPPTEEERRSSFLKQAGDVVDKKVQKDLNKIREDAKKNKKGKKPPDEPKTDFFNRPL